MNTAARNMSLACHCVAGLALATVFRALPAAAQTFGVASLVTDNQAYATSQGYGAAVTVDPNLVNPWGMDRSSTGAWFIANAGTEASPNPGVGQYYTGAGAKAGSAVSIPQTFDPPNGPTGVVYNPSSAAFTLPGGGHSQFLVSNLDGSISGVAAGSTLAVRLVQGATPQAPPPPNMAPDHSIYTGLAIGTVGSSSYLYAANNRTGGVDVYNTTLAPVSFGAKTFTDKTTAGLVPFNAQNLGGNIWVTYAIPGPGSAEAGLGSGMVDEYSASGVLIMSIKDSHMSSPWALAIAPSSFGALAGDLLVGNFSHDDDGQRDAFINAFNMSTGAFVGTLNDANGHPILLPGLWQLEAGNGGLAGSAGNLYFAAGIGEEQHGLFGFISSAPEPSTWALMIVGLGLVGAGLRSRPRFGAAETRV